ncbi:unnamed protein product [Clonostachys byssicola]|uniref:Uncharacterized protein n=1 Tax=Clonostachys byssicola TaxID=160290 RepID=A0A9N9Y3E2_9HYPO|nr:unnamed protein product [Clonostachys byssicola]
MIASPAAVDSSVITENYPSRRGSRDTRSDGNIQLALPEPPVSQQGTDAYAEETFDFMECNMEDTLTGFTPPDDFFATMGEYASDAHGVTQSMPLLSPLNTPMADKATNTLTEDSISPSRTSPFDKMSSNNQCDPLRQLSQLDHDLIVLCSKLEQATPEVLMHALFEVGEGDSSYSGVMKDILEKTTRYPASLIRNGRLSLRNKLLLSPTVGE